MCVCVRACMCIRADSRRRRGRLEGGEAVLVVDELGHFCSHFKLIFMLAAVSFFMHTPLPPLTTPSPSPSLVVCLFCLASAFIPFYSTCRALSCHNYHSSALLQLLRFVFIRDSLQWQQQHLKKHLEQQQKQQREQLQQHA